MAKRLPMTRERQTALPVILRAARAAFENIEMPPKDEAELRRALAAFDCGNGSSTS